MSAVSESEVDRRPPMERLLSASVPSRLHLAMLLVGWLKLDPRTVLDLSWSQVDTDTRCMLTDRGVVHYGEQLDELLHWHEVRQRLDWLVTTDWTGVNPAAGRVFRTDTGADFDTDTANVEVARCCTLAGVPVVPLSGLRHPSWSR